MASGPVRPTVVAFWRTVWVIGLLSLLGGLAVSGIGLVVGFAFGAFIVLWIGLGVAGLGLVVWFVSMVSVMGIARIDAEAAFRTYQHRQSERHGDD